MGSHHQTTNVYKKSVDNQKIDNVADNTHTVNNNWDVHHDKVNNHQGDVILGSAVNLGNSVNTGNRCMGGPGDCPQLINLNDLNLNYLQNLGFFHDKTVQAINYAQNGGASVVKDNARNFVKTSHELASGDYANAIQDGLTLAKGEV